MTLENISCYKSKAVFPMCMWYHKWQKFVSQENLDPRLWLLRSRLWFSQFCSFGFHSDSSICSTMPFPSIWKFWSCCLSFHWLSIIFTMGYLVSHCLWLVLIGTVFVIIWEMFHERISLISASVAASEFCEWVQVGIDVTLIESIRSSLTNLYGFHLLVLLP